MAYAEVSDIETRLGRTFTAEETPNIQALLDGASAVLNKLVNVTGDTEQNALLKFVCTNMVSRMVSSSSGFDALGASQASITAGAYTQSYSFSTPYGDMYLTKLEKRLLGITTGFIGSLQADIDGWYGSNDSGCYCNRL